MKIYAGLTITFVLVILLGSLPISEGLFYRPTHKFLKKTAILEKQREKRFEKSGNAAPWRLCYWRWKTICIGANKTHYYTTTTLSKTNPVYISPSKVYELLFEMF